MRSLLIPAVAALGLALAPANAKASWLSEAIHNLRGDNVYPGNVYTPGYGVYAPDYSVYTPGYSVYTPSYPAYLPGYVDGYYTTPGIYSYGVVPYRTYYPRYYGGWHGYGWHDHHGDHHGHHHH
jgi:hypothetical protein